MDLKFFRETLGFSFKSPWDGVNECTHFPGVGSLSATCPRISIFILLMSFTSSIPVIKSLTGSYCLFRTQHRHLVPKIATKQHIMGSVHPG